MKEFSVTLKGNELTLFQSIQRFDVHPEVKNDLIKSLIKQVKDLYELIPSKRVQTSKKTQKWLKVGNRRLFQDIAPVKVEENSPLASNMIVEQRKCLYNNE